MGVTRRAKCLAVLLVLLNAGCGADGTGATQASPDASRELPGAAEVFVARPEPTPVGTTVPAATPSSTPTAVATASPAAVAVPSFVSPAKPGAVVVPSATATPADADSILEAAQNSSFHRFGDDVYTWDGDRRIVVLKVPVAHPALAEVRDLRGHWDGTIEDTPGTRLWVQQCARRHSDEALGAPDEVYGAVAAQSIYSCLGGLAHLAELFARYWWTEAGVACAADSVTAHSLQGDAQPRPLAVCPSVGYNPTVPRTSGWLAQRCAEIVAVNPNPGYPTDPAQSGDPLPSCWAPIIEVIEAHAAENSEIGLPDSPHDCYHAFLGYVWARQTGRESRPPSDLAVGCHYRAFEAIP